MSHLSRQYQSSRTVLHVMLCYVMSCHVMSYHVISCHVMSCHVMSCHVMSCHVMSCHVMLCHVMSCHIMSCHVISCHVMSCHTVVQISLASCLHYQQYLCPLYDLVEALLLCYDCSALPNARLSFRPNRKHNKIVPFKKFRVKLLSDKFRNKRTISASR